MSTQRTVSGRARRLSPHHLGLPSTTARSSHTSRPDGSLDYASHLADRICEVTLQPTTASVSPAMPDDTAELWVRIEELSRQVASQRASQTRSRSHSRGHRRSTLHTSPACQIICWYHWRFGDEARKYVPPCSRQQASTAANVCTTSSCHLFVTDRISKQQYLMDTGSDLCVFPCKLPPGRRERMDYTLYAANGTTIPTYRLTSRSLKLGLRRDFTWRFVMADVQLPITGVDLLSHYGLLPDGVTSLSTPGHIAPPAVPSVKVIACGMLPDSLLQIFPELTKPTRIHRELRHNTTHHIRRIPGPPVVCRTRRLAPDRLAVAKAHFDSMLRDGTARRAEGPWSSALHLVPKDSG